MGLSSLLAIASKHEFPSRSIDFAHSFEKKSGIYDDVLVDITLVMWVDENRG